uniref:Homeobox domain-containing protein n=1 Tax=Octopus bimaculoides TaxID=37653 RepID=A0A0L8HQX7_OCTBM
MESKIQELRKRFKIGTILRVQVLLLCNLYNWFQRERDRKSEREKEYMYDIKRGCVALELKTAHHYYLVYID